MAAMVRQEVKEEKKPFLKTAAYIFFVVLVVSLLVELTNKLPQTIGGIVSIIILVGTMVYCSYIINRKLAKYTYILIERELFFYKQIGKREKEILQIKLKDLEWVKPLREVKGEKRIKKRTYILTCRAKDKRNYVGQFTQGDKKYRVIFQPQEDLKKHIVKN